MPELQLFPEAASEAAGRSDQVYFWLLALLVFFTVTIYFGIAVLVIRYRRRKGVRAEPTKDSLALEVTWAVVPLIIVLGTFAWGAQVFYDMKSPPADAMEIFVTGKQWMWKIQHPTGHREINTLHLPTGRKVRLTMTSEDVIHSFFIPAFRVKQDTVPGMYTRMWFEPTKPGTYHLFCAEYCGTKHAEMIGKVIVMDPADYEAWLSGQAAELPPAEAGKVLFESLRCNTCHAAGSGQRGPDLAGRWGKPVELQDGRRLPFLAEYVRESILEPRKKISKGFEPLMPTYKGQVTEGQILQLIAFLKSQSEGARK
ncbi:MAG: cytochrome c oxidase subunit II [Planctomycetota bacterium]|jgi:cytochrome c oxidase subunit 2